MNTGLAESGVEELPRRNDLWKVENAGQDVLLVSSLFAGVKSPVEWKDRLYNALRSSSDIAVVGAKRIDSAGRIFSMGENIIHPKGFHCVGHGMPGSAYRFPEEVDVISGGCVMVDRRWFDNVCGLDLLSDELGLLKLSLAIRKAGGRCVVVPQAVVADDAELNVSGAAEERFRDEWGFDWMAPDLDCVRRAYSGTGLLWNVRFHADYMPFEKYENRPAFHWKNYCDVPVFRQRADHLTGFVQKYCGEGKLLDIGCGDGLYSHLAALAGAEVTGIDLEEPAVRQAEALTSGNAYPASCPEFMVGSGSGIDFDDESFDMLMLNDVIEHLPNPVGVLREAERILKPGGYLMVVTPAWMYGRSSDPVYHIAEYSQKELISQVTRATGMSVIEVARLKRVYRDIILIAGKQAD